MEPKKDALIWSIGELDIPPTVTERILNYLDYESVKHAQNVCNPWKTVIQQKEIWKKLYERNFKKPNWQRMKHVLELRNSPVFSDQNNNNFYEEACCLIGDSLKKLENNWITGTHIHISFYLDQATAKNNIINNDFHMNVRWIFKALPGGRISIRNRWAPEADHTAELLPNEKVPFDNLDNHPIIESVLCSDNIMTAIGKVDTRKILFVFEIKKYSEPPQLRCTAWRVIEDTKAQVTYTFDSKNCMYLKGDALLLCGKKVAGNLATVVTLMNPKEKTTIFTNQEVPERVGNLFDFAIDDWRIILFLGSSENPRFHRIDRYRIQIRDLATFALIKGFVLPLVYSTTCHFDYSNGFAVTGSNDSPIRIWNVSEGTLGGDFDHEGNLSAVRIVADKIIITCDQRGIIKIWNMRAALDPSIQNEPSSILLKKLDAPIPPYWKFRTVKVLAVRADEFQIVLALQYDTKSPLLYIMDFLAEEIKEVEKTPRRGRKRRQI